MPQATSPAGADELPPGVLVANDPVPVETFAADPDPVADWLDPTGVGQTREPADQPSLVPQDDIAGAVLAVARAELGTIGGARYRQYWKAPATAAWCAYFACWVLRKAGVGDGPATGWTPTIVRWGKDRGRWKTSGARPGDLVLFQWPTVPSTGRGDPPVCHVGIVETVHADGTLTTIEGNTSAKVHGSQYNGNVCARKVRATHVVGFVSVDDTPPDEPPTTDLARQEVQTILHTLGFFAGPVDGVTDPAAATRAFQRAAGLTEDAVFGPVSRAAAALVPAFPGSTERGHSGAATRAFQQRLHDRGATIDVDGVHGPHTSSVLAAFQKANGLDVDGVGGPQTWTALYARPV